MQSEPSLVFTRAEARSAGWSDAALSRAANDGRVTRLRRGFFTVGGASAEVHAIAAARACAGSTVSHRSALLLHGLPCLAGPPPVPDLTVAPHTTGQMPAAHLYRAGLEVDEAVEIDGIRVTSVARTLIDVGRHCSLRTTVAAMDAALHLGLVAVSELEATQRRCWNWPGIFRASRALLRVDPRAESPLETVSRLTLHAVRLAPSHTQPIVRDETGRFVARPDFGWAREGVVGEADGMSKYASPDTVRQEKLRQESLEQLGLVVVRWTWADAMSRPQVLRARILGAFDRAAALRRSGFTVGCSISGS